MEFNCYDYNYIGIYRDNKIKIYRFIVLVYTSCNCFLVIAF